MAASISSTSPEASKVVESLKVQQLAKQQQISADTIRHYVRIGLLTPHKDASGYHRFDNDQISRLDFIRQARDLGFTLDDIQQILDLAEQGQSPCPEVRQLIEPRLAQARERLAQMQAMVVRMETAVERWQQQPDCLPCGDHICHLIEGIEGVEGVVELSPSPSKEQTQTSKQQQAQPNSEVSRG